jgi:hypothetical protein
MRKLGWLSWVLLSGCTVGGGAQDWSFEDVRSVEVNLGSGDANVRALFDERTTSVTYSGGGVGSDNIRPDVTFTDGFLVIDADGGALGGGDVDVFLPAGVDIAVWVKRGAANVYSEEPANIWACTIAGEVSIGAPPGRYDLELGVAAGAISEAGFTHDENAPKSIGACVAAGAVRLYPVDD